MRAGPLTAYFLPRDLKPAAWWIWAIGMSVAATRTTNPWLLITISAVACFVVVARRPDAPWAMSFRIYLSLAGIVILVRVVFRIIFGGAEGSTILLRLPEIPLPAWAAGIRLFGDVSAESVLGGLYDGLRLATMIICVGAANSLANPKRMLKSLPPALYEVGTAVIVALSVFPQLAESAQRVHAARKLRGGLGRLPQEMKPGSRRARAHGLRAVAIPVLEDALDRSLQLAASMDSRGYGQSGTMPRGMRIASGVLVLVGLCGVCVGVYGFLDGSTPRYLGTPMLLAGTGMALLGFKLAGRRVQRTIYRPDRWQLAELVVVASGLGVAFVMFATSSVDPTNLNPSLVNLSWPQLSWFPLCGVMIGVLPAFLTPPPESPYAAMHDDPSIGDEPLDLPQAVVA